MMPKRILSLIFLISFAAMGANWDKDAFYVDETQSLKVQLSEDSGEGVLLLKHFKYGKPVYLVSAFEKQDIVKTRMVSRVKFYEFYEEVFKLIKQKQASQKVDSCEGQVAVTVNLGSQRDLSRDICVQAGQKEKKELSNWLFQIKSKL